MKRALLLMCSLNLFVTSGAFGSSTGGSIAGTVKDTAGSVIPLATVMAVNEETSVANSTRTNKDGSYSFPDLPIGHYSVKVQANGFSEFRETGVVLNVNAALRVDATLSVGRVNQQVQVSGTAVEVDMISTQLGDVIGSTSMTSLPLNGRSYTDLLALQPGVVPQ